MIKTPQKTFSLLTSLFVSASLCGCVSVNLGSSKSQKSEQVKFEAPTGAFKSIDNSNADQAWQSQTTGNTISFLSECPAPDASLEGMTDEFTGILKAKQVKTTKEEFFNGREALHTWTEGKLDGIAMKVHSLVFKRNGCSYLMTLVGRAKAFDQDQAIFNQFILSFEAP